MARALTAFARRRATHFAVFATISLVLVLSVRALSTHLYNTSLMTGWSLLALVVALAFFNARKKLPFIPMGRASAWLQFHLYAGMLAVVMFLLHLHGRINGALQTTLAVLFVLVVCSGAIGILLSRDYARRLTSRGQEVIFERIPALRRRIRDRAEELILTSVTEQGSTALADFYAHRLVPYLDGPRNTWRHLFESKRPQSTWSEEFAALDRYLSDSERDWARELSELVLMKDDLDYHYALQGALKLWLFVHVPLTYVMLILGVFHGLLAQAFSAGGR
jgi:hypothetical protein